LLTFQADTVNIPFGKGDISTGNIDESSMSSNIGWAAKCFFDQSKNLSRGYHTLADEYDAQNPRFRAIANAEDSYRVTMKTIGNAVDYAKGMEGSMGCFYSPVSLIVPPPITTSPS
jgi:hypothetical protein